MKIFELSQTYLSRPCNRENGGTLGMVLPALIINPINTPYRVWGAWRIIPLSKWLITMVSKSPNWGYSPYKWPKWLINGGDPKYLLTGMILQVSPCPVTVNRFWSHDWILNSWQPSIILWPRPHWKIVFSATPEFSLLLWRYLEDHPRTIVSGW